jgi:predicted protein tyrosine phosphatase
MNKWRSPTAEKIYNKHNQLQTRSAGTSGKARKTISHLDIKWADIICVMESKHKNRLKADFRDLFNYKKIYVLDIEDNYQYMDTELIEILQLSVDPIIEENQNQDRTWSK